MQLCPNVPLLGALGPSGLDALITSESATDGAVFRAFVAQVLCPTLHAGVIGVRDNLRAHTVAGLEAAIPGGGAHLSYWPPSAPDLSPLALCLSQRKAC